jgi:hypothetical protein
MRDDIVLDDDLPADFDPDELDTSDPRPDFVEVSPDEVEDFDEDAIEDDDDDA